MRGSKVPWRKNQDYDSASEKSRIVLTFKKRGRMVGAVGVVQHAL
jgi:hypothetical protein